MVHTVILPVNLHVVKRLCSSNRGDEKTDKGQLDCLFRILSELKLRLKLKLVSFGRVV